MVLLLLSLAHCHASSRPRCWSYSSNSPGNVDPSLVSFQAASRVFRAFRDSGVRSFASAWQGDSGRAWFVIDVPVPSKHDSEVQFNQECSWGRSCVLLLKVIVTPKACQIVKFKEKSFPFNQCDLESGSDVPTWLFSLLKGEHPKSSPWTRTWKESWKDLDRFGNEAVQHHHVQCLSLPRRFDLYHYKPQLRFSRAFSRR